MSRAPGILAALLIAAILATALVLEPVPCAIAGGCVDQAASAASSPRATP
jgi:hypothetical protein